MAQKTKLKIYCLARVLADGVGGFSVGGRFCTTLFGTAFDFATAFPLALGGGPLGTGRWDGCTILGNQFNRSA